MIRLIPIKLVLTLWCVAMVSGQSQSQYGTRLAPAHENSQQLPPVGQILSMDSLSPDNPMHKQIINWIDNYRRHSGEMSITEEQSKQDLVAPNYASINAALRQVPNHSPTSSADGSQLPTYLEEIMKATPQNEKPVILDTAGLSQIFTPHAFAQGLSHNQPVQSQPQTEERILVDPAMHQRLLDQNRQRIDKLDPVVQDHIRKLQEQSNDGRTLLVEVRGDNTRDDSSLLDKLRPILYDPSVLDQLRPQLKESKSLLSNQNNPISAQSPVIFEHKRPVLRYDRPLLEQRDRIDELRHSLDGQRPVSTATRLTHEEQKQIQRGQFNTQYLPQHQIFQLGQPQGTVTDKNSLMKQLNNLALQPLINQSPVQHQGQSQQEPVLLGQRQRQQPQLVQQPLTFHWQSGQQVANQDDNQQNHQVAKRQESNDGNWDWNGQDNRWDDISNEPDPQKQKLLRDDLHRHLQEQDRKRQELMELDQRQRQMIAEERKKQEERDRWEAERRALMKKQQANKQLQEQKKQDQQGWLQPQWQTQPAKPIAVSPVATPSVPQRHQSPEHRWNGHDNTALIRNKVVDKNQALSTGSIDVLHSIQPQAPRALPAVGAPAINSWPSNAVSQSNEKDRPIIINPAALEQAEQSDAEYIRLLKDILLSGHSGSSEPKTVFVPVNQQSGAEGGSRGRWT